MSSLKYVALKSVVFVILGCLAVLALAVGCGGGGGGGGGGGFNMFLSPTSASIGFNGRVRLAATDQNGNPTDVTWSATAGFITPLGIGVADFTAPSSGASATVTATSVVQASIVRTCEVSFVAGVATVTGRVRQSGGGPGIPGIVVEFRNASNVTVATATTSSAGYFSGAVPTSATRFHLRNSSISSGYYKQFAYDGFRFSTLIGTCSAPLPALTAAQNFPLNGDITLNPTSGPPPPPPNGCP